MDGCRVEVRSSEPGRVEGVESEREEASLLKGKRPLPLQAALRALGLTVAGRVADLATTYLALLVNPFAFEANPFMRSLLPSPALALMVQLLGGFLMWLCSLPGYFRLVAAGRARAARALLAYAVVLSWLPAPHNACVALTGEGFLPPLYP